uniref:Uncharacterized protein n=1 Tax=Cacopsylla melanoneura TaxID=428564 RepID=A0A8D8TG30_9HEMI
MDFLFLTCCLVSVCYTLKAHYLEDYLRSSKGDMIEKVMIGPYLVDVQVWKNSQHRMQREATSRRGEQTGKSVLKAFLEQTDVSRKPDGRSLECKREKCLQMKRFWHNIKEERKTFRSHNQHSDTMQEFKSVLKREKSHDRLQKQVESFKNHWEKNERKSENHHSIMRREVMTDLGEQNVTRLIEAYREKVHNQSIVHNRPQNNKFVKTPEWKKEKSKQMKKYWRQLKSEGKTYRDFSRHSLSMKRFWAGLQGEVREKRLRKQVEVLKNYWKKHNAVGRTWKHKSKERSKMMVEYWRKIKEIGNTDRQKSMSKSRKAWWNNKEGEKKRLHHGEMMKKFWVHWRERIEDGSTMKSLKERMDEYWAEIDRLRGKGNISTTTTTTEYRTMQEKFDAYWRKFYATQVFG